MLTDSQSPDPVTRGTAQQLLLAFMQQKPFIGMVSEQSPDLTFSDLKTNYQAADKALVNACQDDPSQLELNFFNMIFTTALYRDESYLIAGRKYQRALGLHDAYHRNYRASLQALRNGIGEPVSTT